MSKVTDLSLYNRIEAGEFNGPPLPDRPRKPAILKRTVGELTDGEIATLPSIRKEYEAVMVAYEAALSAYRKGANDARDAFNAALADEHGVPADHPFVVAILSMAYDRGHSGGYGQVAASFSDLMPLWEEAQKMRGA